MLDHPDKCLSVLVALLHWLLFLGFLLWLLFIGHEFGNVHNRGLWVGWEHHILLKWLHVLVVVWSEFADQSQDVVRLLSQNWEIMETIVIEYFLYLWCGCLSEGFKLFQQCHGFYDFGSLSQCFQFQQINLDISLDVVVLVLFFDIFIEFGQHLLLSFSQFMVFQFTRFLNIFQFFQCSLVECLLPKTMMVFWEV